MTSTIYFIRHGQTDWNAEGRLQGQEDIRLNDTGRGQATRNGGLLARLIGDSSKIDFVSSPLSRTRETMERIRIAMGLPPEGYRMDERLLEVHFGDWQGHTFRELELADPGCYARREEDKWRFLPPGDGAETYEQVAERVRLSMRDMTGDTVCVAHGGILRAVFWLTKTLTPAEAAALAIPQDRVLRYAAGRLEWL